MAIATQIAGYIYRLDDAEHRLSVTEHSGCSWMALNPTMRTYVTRRRRSANKADEAPCEPFPVAEFHAVSGSEGSACRY